MKDLTLCVVCVILGILLSMLFKQACGCKNVVEGLGLGEDCGIDALKKNIKKFADPVDSDGERLLDGVLNKCDKGLICNQTTNKCEKSNIVKFVNNN